MKSAKPTENDLPLAVAPDPGNAMQVAPAAAPAAPNVASMLEAVIKGGVTNENVAALEKMVSLYERVQDKDAEKAFAAAFVQLQSEMKKVKATETIPSRDGTIRSRFAPYEKIMEQVKPLLEKHGFTVRFTTDFKEGRLIKTCIVQHVGGHSEATPFAVRIGSGPPGASEAQSDGAASTYAKRFALCDALNIVIDKDVDAAAEGDIATPVTQAQADELQRRVVETESNVEAFLKLGGVTGDDLAKHRFSKILASKYDMLDGMLKQKERKGR